MAAQDLTNTDFVRQTTAIVEAADYISALVIDGAGDCPFTLVAGDKLQIIKTQSGDVEPTLNDGSELVTGTVPAATTWKVTISINITQTPPA